MSERLAAPLDRTNTPSASRSGGALQPKPAIPNDERIPTSDDEERMPPDQRDAKAERAREIRYGSNLSQLPVHGSSSLVGVDDRSMLGSRRSSNQVYHDSTRESAPSGLIVEDTLGELAPGQTRVGAFLAALRSSLTETAEQVLAETTWSTDKCPSIAEWFGYYETKEATHIEAAILKFVPEAARATTAEEYIPLISERVRQSVATWVRTGDVVGMSGKRLWSLY